MTGLLRLLTRERELRMIWELRKEGKRSYLVGTAHFFPFHFRGALRRYLSRVETVLLEGPLDEEAMRRVVESGSANDGGRSLGNLLDPRTIVKINRELRAPTPALSTHRLYQDLIGVGPEDLVGVSIRGLTPWMAFFRIWTHYLRQNGWTHTMELNALRVAAELRKPVHFLETIEEQIAALNGIPLQRIVRFLDAADWAGYRREYVRNYLRGALDAMIANARVFPTFCEAIVDRRDPVLHERMGPHLARGNVIAFVGVLHCPGIIALLRGEGYEVASPPGG